jgi:hypothetical protein
MMGRKQDTERKLSPVNTWPWCGWQVYGGSRGLRGG